MKLAEKIRQLKAQEEEINAIMALSHIAAILRWVVNFSLDNYWHESDTSVVLWCVGNTANPCVHDASSPKRLCPHYVSTFWTLTVAE